MRDRSVRRHADRKAKAKVVRHHLTHTKGAPDPEYLTPKQVGKEAANHSRTCSCFICQPDPFPKVSDRRRLAAAEEV